MEMKERIKELEKKLEEKVEKGEKLTRDDIKEIVMDVLKIKEERLTRRDIENIVESVLKRAQPPRPSRYTPEEIEAMKIEKEYELKMEELKQKKETYDAIGRHIKEGFSLLGRAIARTLIEEETGMEYEAEGIQSRELIEVPCPSCGNNIIAPIDADRITCPNCGKTWVVERGGANPSPPTSLPPPPPITPKSEPQAKPMIEEIQPEGKEEEVEEEIKEEEIQPEQPEEKEEEKEEVPILKDANGMFVCPVCDKKFKNRAGLKSHMRVHKEK